MNTFEIVCSAVRRKGFGVHKATREDVELALRSEGIDTENYNFSMEDGKKDLYIDAYETGDDIFLYKGYGNSQALCHEFIHKWWKERGNKMYLQQIKKLHQQKWNEIVQNEEYSVILDNENEICGEVLAKSYETLLNDFVEQHAEKINNTEFLQGLQGEIKEKNISQLTEDDFTKIIAYDLFNGKKWGNGKNLEKNKNKNKFSILQKVRGVFSFDDEDTLTYYF